jgi:hypothetical protein
MQTTSDRLWLRRTLALIALSGGGCFEALIGDGEVCRDEHGKFVTVGETFIDGCKRCVCQADGTSACSSDACASDASGEPSGAPDACGPGDGGVPPDADVHEDGGPDASATACTFDDLTFALGQTLERSDGCGPCTCVAVGQLECEIAPRCRDAATPACTYQGGEYLVGPFESADGCQQCTCNQDGTVDCSGEPCSDAGAPGCIHDGETVPPGTFFAGDGVSDCSTCTCHEDGEVRCESNPCLPDGGAGTCTFAEKTWPVGTTLYTGVDCNTCTCVADGKAECRPQLCTEDAGLPDAGG